jgi:5-methylthioadenosine/S-adenosylhomocysteine deaminase
MATRGSSACIGWPQLGRIEPGCPADIVALDLSAPNMQPMFNPISQIVYATTGGEVSMTMVNGIVLYKDGEHKTLDNSALNEAAKSAKDWVFSKATSK